MYVLKIKVEKHSSIPGDPSFCWYRSLHLLCFQFQFTGKKTLSLAVFFSAEYHSSGIILATHFIARALKSLDFVSGLPIALSFTNQINSAWRTQAEIDISLSSKQLHTKSSSHECKWSHSQGRWTDVTCCSFILQKCRPNFAPLG